MNVVPVVRSPIAAAVLSELLTRHGVNALGVELVHTIRSGSPVRAVAGSGGNVTGRYPSSKMGCTIAYESRTVELAFVIECETAPDVHEYFDQPDRLSLDYPSAGGRRVVTSHVPDFFVVSESFVGFVECKMAEALPKLVERKPRSLSDLTSLVIVTI